MDSADEILGQIMSHEEIITMPYREVIYALERRRLFLEKNKSQMESKELEKQLTGNKKSQNR